MQQPIKLHHKVRAKLAKKLGGSTPVRIAKRARILLLSHQWQSVERVAAKVGCSVGTVRRVRRRCLELGWEEAIYDAARPGRPKKLSEREERELIALACTDPPQGYARWTVRLLVKHCGKGVGFGVVQQVLKEDGLKPWREKNVVCTDTGRGV